MIRSETRMALFIGGPHDGKLMAVALDQPYRIVFPGIPAQPITWLAEIEGPSMELNPVTGEIKLVKIESHIYERAANETYHYQGKQ